MHITVNKFQIIQVTFYWNLIKNLKEALEVIGKTGSGIRSGKCVGKTGSRCHFRYDVLTGDHVNKLFSVNELFSVNNVLMRKSCFAEQNCMDSNEKCLLSSISKYTDDDVAKV